MDFRDATTAWGEPGSHSQDWAWGLGTRPWRSWDRLRTAGLYSKGVGAGPESARGTNRKPRCSDQRLRDGDSEAPLARTHLPPRAPSSGMWMTPWPHPRRWQHSRRRDQSVMPNRLSAPCAPALPNAWKTLVTGSGGGWWASPRTAPTGCAGHVALGELVPFPGVRTGSRTQQAAGTDGPGKAGHLVATHREQISASPTRAKTHTLSMRSFCTPNLPPKPWE